MFLGMILFLIAAFSRALEVFEIPGLLYGGPVVYALGIFLMLREKSKEQA